MTLDINDSPLLLVRSIVLASTAAGVEPEPEGSLLLSLHDAKTNAAKPMAASLELITFISINSFNFYFRRYYLF